jgi:hypothetical protein
VVVDVVVTVTVALAGPAPVTFTELVTPQVAGLTAPVGMVVTAQERLTVPVKPFVGLAEIDEVLPVVAPAAKVMLPPLLRVKLGAGVTVTPTTVFCESEPDVPVTVTA